MKDPRLFALALAVGASLLNLAIVGILLRASSQRYGLMIFVGVALVIFLSVATLFGTNTSLWHFSAFFGGGVCVAVFLYGAVLKSLSLEMLAELDREKDNSITLDELSRRIVEPAFAQRAALLVELGAVTTDNGGFVVTSKGTASAERLKRLRNALHVESLGLYRT